MQLSGRPLLDNAADQRLFVGRAGAVDRIERSIDAGLNCLVTGVAGSGKTSLVRSVMYRAHLAGRSRAIRYVRGGQAHSAAGLLSAVLAVLGGDPTTSDRAGETDPLTLLDEVAGALAAAGNDAAGDAIARTTVVVVDDVTAAAGGRLFGALRDEVWQLGALWVATTTPAQALDLDRPPADAFFETRVELGPLAGTEVAELLRRRTQPADADPDALIAAVLAGRPDTPRRVLETARDVATTPTVGPTRLTVAQQHRARAVALEQLSRPARMLAQELEAIGWVAASDERLLDRLGWTRTRVIQVTGELRDRGLVQVREERTGRGRPRKLFRVVPAAEFRPPDGALDGAGQAGPT